MPINSPACHSIPRAFHPSHRVIICSSHLPTSHLHSLSQQTPMHTRVDSFLTPPMTDLTYLFNPPPSPRVDHKPRKQKQSPVHHDAPFFANQIAATSAPELLEQLRSDSENQRQTLPNIPAGVNLTFSSFFSRSAERVLSNTSPKMVASAPIKPSESSSRIAQRSNASKLHVHQQAAAMGSQSSMVRDFAHDSELPLYPHDSFSGLPSPAFPYAGRLVSALQY